MSNAENDRPVYLNPDQPPMANMLDAALQLLLGNLQETGIPLGTIRTICRAMALLSLASPIAWSEFRDNTLERPGDGEAVIRTLSAIAQEAYRSIPGFPPIPQPDPDLPSTSEKESENG